MRCRSFKMLAGATQFVGRVLSNETAADTLDGPWDEAFSGTDGTLYFLKGYRMIAVDGMSGAGRAAAVKFAPWPRLALTHTPNADMEMRRIGWAGDDRARVLRAVGVRCVGTRPCEEGTCGSSTCRRAGHGWAGHETPGRDAEAGVARDRVGAGTRARCGRRWGVTQANLLKMQDVIARPAKSMGETQKLLDATRASLTAAEKSLANVKAAQAKQKAVGDAKADGARVVRAPFIVVDGSGQFPVPGGAGHHRCRPRRVRQSRWQPCHARRRSLERSAIALINGGANRVTIFGSPPTRR